MSSQGSNSPQGFPTTNQPFVNSGLLITQVWRQFLFALWTRTGSAAGGQTVQTGTIQDFAGTVVPDGFLLCDGTAVSRVNYPNLFSVIGVAWGIGDGSTTFNLPNLIDRTTLGSTSGGVGTTGGADSATLDVANLPAHNHGITDPGHTHAVTDPQHTHAITDPGHVHTSLIANSINTTGANVGATQAGNTGSATTGITVNPASTGVTVNTAVTGITTDDTGSGDPISILPPYASVIKMIKT